MQINLSRYLSRVAGVWLISFSISGSFAQGIGGMGMPSSSGLGINTPLPPGITPGMAAQILRDASAAQQGSVGGLPVTPEGFQSPSNLGSVQPFLATQLEYRPGSFGYFVEQATGKTLPLFGSNFFNRANSFMALQSQPVPASYVVGPGDEIILKVSGGVVDFDQRLVVDRAGMVLLPRIGPVSVAGLKVSELEPALRRQFSRILSDFSLFASMGSLRGIEIYVVGQAQSPGKYVVSSLSTLISALFSTGGPSLNGSMRKIELVRGSKVVAQVDLYEFIRNGDTSSDMRLLPGDVINIPFTGPRVALVGSVTTEAIFELPGRPQVSFVADLLTLAGGLPIVSSPIQASLERVEPGQSRPLRAQVIALDDAGRRTPIQDGDILTVFPVKPAFENAITLRVLDAAPLRIPIAPGARVSDVIPSRDSLLTEEFWARRFGAVRENEQSRQERKLEEQSRIARLRNPQTLRQEGGRPPGEFSPPVMPDRDRTVPAEQQSRTDQFLDVENRRMTRPEINTNTSSNTVDMASTLSAMRESLQLSQINWDMAIIERVRPNDLGLEVIPFHLVKAILDKDPAHNVSLETGDTITIFSQRSVQGPESRQIRLIRIEGELQQPGIYQLKPGETLAELIQRAGGLTGAAYRFGLELKRESVRRLQRENLDLIIRQLESALSSNLASQNVNASTPEEFRAMAELRSRNQQVARDRINRLKSLTPSGRLSLELDPDRQRLPDISLEDGDSILIPRTPSHVSAVGAVFNDSMLIYRPGRTVQDVVRVAGPLPSADLEKAFVLRADGSALVPQQSTSGGWFGTRGFGDWFGNRKPVDDIVLMPGDTVIIPDKEAAESGYSVFMRGLKDWTQVIYQLGLSAAALKTLQ